jgi:tetratricopeptide (TPR) repeat protein
MTRAALVATLLATTSVFAAPKSGEARVQFDKGVAAYTKGDYAAAAEALGASFVLEADPETLFAWAQTERKLGHCDRAIDLYGKLLTMDLPAENKQAIRVQISECKAIIAEQKPTKPGDKSAGRNPADSKLAASSTASDPNRIEAGAPIDATSSETAQLDTTARREEPSSVTNEGRAWWKDPVGGALVGTGAVALGVGIVFLVQGSAANSDKDGAMTYPEYEALANRAESRGRLGVISLVAGGALATAGVVWYVTRKPSSERAVTTLVLPSGGGVALSGRF